MSGEAAFTEDMITDWLGVKLPALLREYQPVDVFKITDFMDYIVDFV